MRKTYIMKYTKDDITIDTNGVVRWNSSNNVPPDDILTEFLLANIISQEEVLRSISKRKEEDIAFLEAYVARRKKYGYTDEEKFEMRAAFGGEEVVDFLTGLKVSY